MDPPRPLFWYDLVDPLSWLLDRELQALEEEEGRLLVHRAPAEWNPPPSPLLDPEGEAWRTRRQEATELAAHRGIELAEPFLVPWSRKAHELVLLGREEGGEAELRQALFQAFHTEGRDIGRVDVLVGIAVDAGQDRSHAKAVLDVDRHAAAVARSTAEAREAGALPPPALRLESGVVRGFHDRHALRTLLIP